MHSNCHYYSRDGFQMHEVAIPPSVARILLVLPAGGLAEVGDGRELGDDGAAIVVAALERLSVKGDHILWIW